LKRDETRKNRMDKIQAKPAESINPEVAQAQQEVSQEQAAKAKKARKKVADQ
jgi:peptide subunit release factor 1 (eRF1)